MDIDLNNVVDINLLSAASDGRVIEVQREVVFADGTVIPGKHVFPVDTMEWRAAEYEIDPADQDTLLDIVLHEPFLADPDKPEMTLANAPSVAQARAYHLSRVQAVMARSRRPKAKAPDPVRENIKALSVMNPEAVALKGALVARVRKAKMEEPGSMAARGMVPEEARIEALRGRLVKGTTGPGNGKEKSNG